jgi:hypothetical protein
MSGSNVRGPHAFKKRIIASSAITAVKFSHGLGNLVCVDSQSK